MNYIKITDNVYSQCLGVILHEDFVTFKTFIEDNYKKEKNYKPIMEELETGCGNGMLIFGLSCAYLFVKDFKKTNIENQITLWHELNHFVDFTLEAVGVPLSVENTEARAYYYAYIQKKIIKEINKK